MMKRIILLFLASIGIVCSSSAQQDSQFTQYIFNTIHINPAYTGYKKELYIQAFYRAQWVGVRGAPTTVSVAVDGAIDDGNVGLGFIASNDKIGAQKNLSAYANYAYKIQLGYDENSKLSFGLAAGVMQLGLDGDKLTSIDPDDEVIPTGMQTRFFPDARAGIYYSNEKYFAGLSASNLIASWAAKNYSNNLLVPVPQPHIFLTAGALIPITYGWALKPVILLKDDIKGPTSLDVNAFLLLNEKVWIGGFYRTTVPLYNKKFLQKDLTKKNALGMMFELFATDNLRVGYSYDYSLNKLQYYNYGSHEFSVGIYLGPRNMRKIRSSRCYDF